MRELSAVLEGYLSPGTIVIMTHPTADWCENVDFSYYEGGPAVEKKEGLTTQQVFVYHAASIRIPAPIARTDTNQYGAFPLGCDQNCEC